MVMKMKWVLAGLGAVALAAVAITSAMPWLSHSDVHTVSAEACPVDAIFPEDDVPDEPEAEGYFVELIDGCVKRNGCPNFC